MEGTPEINRGMFCDIYREYITRPGAEKLLEWIESTDFFTAPASTRYHLSVEGGLCAHSLNVYTRLRRLMQDENRALDGDDFGLTSMQMESAAVCGLLHDLCKANVYQRTAAGWVYAEKYPLGHGEKSLSIIQQHMTLYPGEALAIRWHMGAYDDAVKGGFRGLGSVYAQYPMALLLHIADMEATYLDERG